MSKGGSAAGGGCTIEVFAPVDASGRRAVKPFLHPSAWIGIASLILCQPIAAQPVDFTLEPVDSSGDVGISASLAVDGSGKPHVAYLDLTNNMLRHAWRDAAGWHTEPVAAADV